MSVYRIRKIFKIEYAHQLDSSFLVDCRSLHGHSAIIEVFLSSQKLDNTGMVMDFGEVKNIVGDMINRYDHAVLLPNTLPNIYISSIIEFNNPTKVHILPFNPTAENLAKFFCNNIKTLFAENKKCFIDVGVRFHETSTGWAEIF